MLQKTEVDSDFCKIDINIERIHQTVTSGVVKIHMLFKDNQYNHKKKFSRHWSGGIIGPIFFNDFF